MLAYHQIVSDGLVSDRSSYKMLAGQFRQQMQYLFDLGYRSLSLQEYLEFPSDKLRHDHKNFVLTFDDGYEDFLINAFPILQQFGFTSTVFLVADQVGQKSCWEGAKPFQLLNWGQIHDLHTAGVSFGSHTYTHPRLPLLSREQINNELTTSKKYLEDKLGRAIPFIAYPYGESTFEIQTLTKQAGYEAACGVITGNRGRYNLWRRPCLKQDSLQVFIYKMTGWYDYVLGFRKWAREDTSIGKYLRNIKHRISSR